MHKIKRQIIAIGLAGSLLISSWIQPAFAQVIYEESENSPLSSGVTYQHILRYTEQGWLNVNVVRIDLKNSNVDLDVLGSANGLNSKDVLTNLMKQKENAVAGINADFFYLTNPDSPLGIMVRDNKIVSSPVLVKPYNALSVTQNGQGMLGPWQNYMSVETARGTKLDVQAYNKITWNYHMITIFDKNWSSMTPGTSAEYPDLVEVIVKDNRVDEIRQGQPSTAMPTNGYVLLASGAQGQAILQSVTVGDSIRFNPSTYPNLSDIKMAVGGGTLLVQNGQIIPFSEPITGNHPRTAVGLNQSCDQLIMVTVDGRHKSYTGLDGKGMAALMIELGSAHAMMFDGGGSTTIATRDLGEKDVKLLNTPSDGSQRRIINGLVVSSKGGTGEFGGLVYQDGADAVFVNNPVGGALKAFDTAYQPMELPSNITYSIIEGVGQVEDNKVIPTQPGKLIVQAECQGKTTQKTFKVLQPPASIQMEVSGYYLNPGESLDLRVVGIDPAGYRATIANEKVTFADDKGLGAFNYGTYTAGQQEGSTIIRAAYNGYNAAVPVAIGSKRTSIGDFSQYNPTFISYPATVTGRVGMVAGGKVNANAIELNYDFTGHQVTTAAYAVLGSGVPLAQRPQKIGVWVNAQQSAPHWIRGQIKDAAGKTYTIEFKQGIDWTGWKYLEANVPTAVAAPAILERLYVVETDPNFKTKGTLLFDGLDIMMPQSLATVSASEAGGQLADTLKQKPSQYDKMWMIYGGSSNPVHHTQLANTLGGNYELAILTGTANLDLLSQTGKTAYGTYNGYTATESGNDLLMFLNDSGDGLRKTDATQWPWLKNMLNSTTKKNVYLFLNKPIWGPKGFSDNLEADLLGDQLTALAQKGTTVYVFYGGGTMGTEMRNGVRYIGTGVNQNQYISLYKSGATTYYTFDPLK